MAAQAGGRWRWDSHENRMTAVTGTPVVIVYADDLVAFEADLLAPVVLALEGHDGPTFERLYATATERANDLHVKWAKPYIRWVLPDQPPEDLLEEEGVPFRALEDRSPRVGREIGDGQELVDEPLRLGLGEGTQVEACRVLAAGREPGVRLGELGPRRRNEE